LPTPHRPGTRARPGATRSAIRRRLGIAERLAQVIPDRRDQDRVIHLLPDILRALESDIMMRYVAQAVKNRGGS
jgi:hypothetical protein